MGGSPGRAPEAAPVRLSGSPDLAAWLAERRVGLAFSTYQSGKLFLVGRKPEGVLAVVERTFNRAMGLWSDGQALWLSSAFQLWRFENCLAAGQLDGGCDRLFVPRVGYTTGDLDIHDVAVDGGGRPVFACTLFNCLATVSDRHGFAPLWRPPFISRLTAEDRCHLNGLAVVEGRPGYVTAASETDLADGWRGHRADGGCVVDVTTGEVVATGLSMPHSPRWHRDRLWLLDSGTGRFGHLEPGSGRFEEIGFCPGYARGLAFSGDYAIVGLSRPRREGTFGGLALDANLKSRGLVARSGLIVIDLRTGEVAHWLRVEGIVEELYDVAVLPGVVRPSALGFKTDEIRYSVTAEGHDGTIWRGLPRG